MNITTKITLYTILAIVASVSTLVYIDSAFAEPDFNPIPEPFTPTLEIFESPLKQLKTGVPIQDIQCNEGLFLIHKQDTLSPACVGDIAFNDLIFPPYSWALMRLGAPAEPMSQEAMCEWYPDVPLVQRNCVNDFRLNNLEDTRFSSVYQVNGTVDSIFYNESSNVIFDVPYTIQGGIVDAMAHDINANSLLVRIDSTSDGFLTIEIPYQLLTYEEQNACDIFTLVNQEEVERKISDSRNGNKIVTVNFTNNYPLVEFIGITMPC